MTPAFDPTEGRAVGGYLGVTLREVTDTAEAGVLPEGAAAVVGTLERAGHLRDAAGDVPLGVHLALVDTVAGICGGLAALPDWVVSSSLHLHRRPLPPTGPLRLEARTLRAGGRAVVTRCEVTDGTGTVCARGILTSAVLTPTGGPPYTARPVQVRFGPPPEGPEARLEAFFPIRVHGPEARVEVLDRLRNPWGILHGGVTGLLVDAAAVGAASTDVPTPPDGTPGSDRRAVAVATTVRFLAPVRTGPAHATATVVVRHGGRTACRVEVRDEGARRLAALATVTVSDGQGGAPAGLR